MEITVECNKLFIQDLPAGGSFLFYLFLLAKQLSSHAFLPFKMCLIRISTTQPGFPVRLLAGFVFNRGGGRDGSLFLGACETPTPSGLYGKDHPQMANRAFTPSQAGLASVSEAWGFCSWRWVRFHPHQALTYSLILGSANQMPPGKQVFRAAWRAEGCGGGVLRSCDSHTLLHFISTKGASSTDVGVEERGSVIFSPTVRTSRDLRAVWLSSWACSRCGSEGSLPLPRFQPAATHPHPRSLFPAASSFFFSVPSAVEPRLR